MNPYLLPEIALQRQQELRLAALRCRPAGRRSHYPVTAASRVHPGGPMRSKPKIFTALLLAAFRKV